MGLLLLFLFLAATARASSSTTPSLASKLAENFVENVRNLAIESTIGQIDFALSHERGIHHKHMCDVCDFDVPDTFPVLCPILGFDGKSIGDIVFVMLSYYRKNGSTFGVDPSKKRLIRAMQAFQRCTRRVSKHEGMTTTHNECRLATQVIQCAAIQSPLLIKPILLTLLVGIFLTIAPVAIFCIKYTCCSNNNNE